MSKLQRHISRWARKTSHHRPKKTAVPTVRRPRFVSVAAGLEPWREPQFWPHWRAYVGESHGQEKFYGGESGGVLAPERSTLWDGTVGESPRRPRVARGEWRPRPSTQHGRAIHPVNYYFQEHHNFFGQTFLFSWQKIIFFMTTLFFSRQHFLFFRTTYFFFFLCQHYLCHDIYTQRSFPDVPLQ